MTMSSFSTLEAECLHQFGVAPRKSECRGCCIKLTWLQDLKENIQLTDELSIQRYVKCHIMLLIGTILFGDKSGAGASRYNCKEIDGPITLLLGWAWIRLPYLSPLPSEPHSFPLANRFMSLGHFYEAFLLLLIFWIVIMSFLYFFQFVWVAYAVDRVDPNIILAEIYMQSVVWSATVSLCHLNVSSGMLPIGIGDSSVSFREYLSRSRIWTRRMEKS
ncbi:hypothetical protein Ahy_B05g078410 isoform C [Arachis hypogaea]|uniref:Aminotransferase-like plant mobile domain-containing protein n=1 Tax=Arachis hypogaea TaxID=3818 RepID=A0A444Z717_ARAHY|nr:hypothetical protein Ahy_B05g078410 isoform C [Arachis hypogaea]